MLALDHLTFRLSRLKPAEQWEHRGDGLAFVIAKSGTINHCVGQSIQRFSGGDIAVFNKATGKLVPAAGDEVLFGWFALHLEHLLPLFAAREIALIQDLADGLRTIKLYPASSAVAIECKKLLDEIPPQFNLDHRSHVLRIAAVILCEELKKLQRHRVGFVRAEEHMVQVFEKIPVDELLTLSVGELAGKFGCSRRHLNRLFHQHFGLSVAALRMEMRMAKAISLLRNPDAKVINVAEQCGFNHLGLFNTCFKKRFGCSPGQWRKAASENKTPASAMDGATEPVVINGFHSHGSGLSTLPTSLPRPLPPAVQQPILLATSGSIPQPAQDAALRVSYSAQSLYALISLPEKIAEGL
jgi:AraC-like DNA-binding protein